MLQTMERLEEAEDFYEQSLGIKERALGPYHQSVADTLFNLGSVRRKLGDSQGAAECFLRSAEVSARGLGPNHPYTLGAIEQLNDVRSEIR